MKPTLRLSGALAALFLLCACNSNDYAGRSDTNGFLYTAPEAPFAMSAMMEVAAPE